MKIPIICVVLAVITASTSAQDTLSIEILEFGAYSGRHQHAVADSAAPTSRVLMEGPVKLIAQTNTIPAVVGRKFGIGFVVKGKPAGKSIPMTVVYRFPKMVNPKTKREISEYRASIQAKAGDRKPRMLWDFTEPWELVPGKWTFQIYHSKQKLAEKSFTVVKQTKKAHQSSRPKSR